MLHNRELNYSLLSQVNVWGALNTDSALYTNIKNMSAEGSRKDEACLNP
jgi:hypothetical protein